MSARTPAEKARYQGLIDLLIPIAKGYVTDRAFEVCSQGVQIYGGYGYTKEYPQEQYLRDCKITHIYEGTNGIQAMDLLGRKLGLNKGQPFRDLLTEIRLTVDAAKNLSGLEDLAEKAEATAAELEKTAGFIGRFAASENAMTALFPCLYVHGCHRRYGYWPGCCCGGRSWLPKNCWQAPRARMRYFTRDRLQPPGSLSTRCFR